MRAEAGATQHVAAQQSTMEPGTSPVACGSMYGFDQRCLSPSGYPWAFSTGVDAFPRPADGLRYQSGLFTKFCTLTVPIPVAKSQPVVAPYAFE